MACSILCDFDGTVADIDVTDFLLETFAEPQWRSVEEDWRAGRIGSAECMARQVALMRAPRAELDRRLDRIDIDPAFPAFARWCLKHAIALTIVSDGLDYAIARILARHGWSGLPIVANRLLAMGGDRYALQSPHADAACRSAAGTCKCAVAQRSDQGQTTILIGDGRSDFCAAGRVDHVIAKASLLHHCRANDLPHVAFAGFAEVPGLVADILDGAAQARMLTFAA